MIHLFDRLPQKSIFIHLPGDEIVEKKHANIKKLTAQMSNSDMSKKATQKWPGLGPNIFQIDLNTLMPEYEEAKNSEQDANKIVQEIPKNELTSEVELKNTIHHKSIIK